uniref:Uncharacterized protein n=1 Tax=Trypanosoma congolense (strain IL3000) TaxID=1068625 RepID=G0UZW5_TRYCI|nr:conserved hypothetical protein [Trypanosoma congolense IL3000]
MKLEDTKKTPPNDGVSTSAVPYRLDNISLLSRADVEAITRRDGEATGSPSYEGGDEASATQQQHQEQYDNLDSRIAALPMFLQSEALALRWHEQQFRHHMKELVELTECMVLLRDGSLRQHSNTVAGRVGSLLDESLYARQAENAALRRMLYRAEELERYVRAAATERVRSAQRMVLAATVARHNHKMGRKSSTATAKVRK